MAETTESGSKQPSGLVAADALAGAPRGVGGAADPAPARPTDRELVLRIAQRDETAMRDLVDRHGTVMFSLALAILRERADAEETCADAFLQAWRTADRFDPVRGSVPGWLATITRSRALDRRRARNRRAEAEPEVLESETGRTEQSPESPDQRAESTERSRLVQAAMSELPESQRRVIELAYFAGMSQSEIATTLNVPLGTVKTRTLAAMKRLRDALAPLLREEVA